MLSTPVNEFGLTISSIAGAQPTATIGTAVTPAQNTYGSYATLLSGASVTDDAWRFRLCVHTVGISANSRPGVIALGVDPAGGTSFTKVVDLLVGPASPYGADQNGYWFEFPFFIKAGSSIGVAASVGSANLTAIRAFIELKCRPTHPELIRAGSYIDSFGVTLASSTGTAITPGTSSKGAWTQMGSNLTKAYWFWDFGYAVANATMTTQTLHIDLGVGDGTNMKTIISNAPLITTASEGAGRKPCGEYGWGASGDGVYLRVQSGSTPDTGQSAAAYAVGG